MRIIAIDPGPLQSALLVYDGQKVESCRVAPNTEIAVALRELSLVNLLTPHTIAIEMIASYGMPVGAEVFETCVWIGFFLAQPTAPLQDLVRIKRIEVKTHLCHSARATDANVRQALIDRFGGKDAAIGKKAKPGPLYGVKGDCWAALAVAVTVHDRIAAEAAQRAA